MLSGILIFKFIPPRPIFTQVKGAKAVAKVRNSNPMRNKAAVGLKAKPMPATATTLVKAVWHGYFFGARRPGQEDEEAAGV